jgi:nucleoside-diphosphate-sugar epimerase
MGSVSNSTVLITGAAGWLGGVLAGELMKDAKTPNLRLILCDIVEPKAPAGAEAVCLKADLCDPAEVQKLFTTEFGVPDTI